ncbi:MAG: DUF3617 domain-containing protein [Methylovirgula sp.]
MTKKGCIAAALLAAIFCGAALADDYPSRKPGLWEVTIAAEGTPAHKMQMCIDAATDQLFHTVGTDLRAKHCAQNNVKVNGTIVTSDSVCKVHGRTVTTTATTNFTGDSAYHSDIKTHFDPALFGKTDRDIVLHRPKVLPWPSGERDPCALPILQASARYICRL